MDLTERECQVLQLMAEGNSSRAAAAALIISKRTVDMHLANAYRKLKAANLMQAVNKAVGLGLIEPGWQIRKFLAGRK